MKSDRKYNFPVLYLEATRKCNRSCPMCMVGCNDAGFVQAKARDELSYDEIVNLVLEPSVRDLGVYQVGYSGGEFLLRADAIELVHKAASLGCEVRITSNATELDRDTLKQLKEAAGGHLVMAFGINAVSARDINKSTRDEELDTTLAAFELCKELGVSRHVIVTVGRFNMYELEDTFAWLQKNHIPFNRSPLTGRCSGKDYFASNGLDAKIVETHLHPAMRKRSIGYISYTPFFLSPELHREISGGNRMNVTVPQNPSIGCWCGTWIAVSAEGDVSPCVTLLDDLVAGNVRDKSIFDIVDSTRIFQSILQRDGLKGRCGRCRYREVCGGCRAMAWYTSHDYMAEDPTCFFHPADSTTVSPYEEETNRTFLSYVKLAAFAGLYEDPDEG